MRKALKTLEKSAFSRLFAMAQREGFELSIKSIKSRVCGLLTNF
jgi:hypothetical protein